MKFDPELYYKENLQKTKFQYPGISLLRSKGMFFVFYRIFYKHLVNWKVIFIDSELDW